MNHYNLLTEEGLFHRFLPQPFKSLWQQAEQLNSRVALHIHMGNTWLRFEQHNQLNSRVALHIHMGNTWLRFEQHNQLNYRRKFAIPTYFWTPRDCLTVAVYSDEKITNYHAYTPNTGAILYYGPKPNADIYTFRHVFAYKYD